MSLKARIVALGLAVVLLASPARAGEVDRYLPADTEVYNLINIRQILSSALVKQVGIENLRALLAGQQELTDILKDLGLDPFKDIEKIIRAQPASGEQDKGLVIVHGRFDVEKFRDRAKKEAKDNKEVVKEVKIAGQECYEIVIADASLSLFIGFPSNKTILAASSKDYLGDALKVKGDVTKGALKNKSFQEMLEKLDDRQSLAMVLNGDVLTKGQLGNLGIADTLGKIKTISGGLTLTDGIKIELSGGAKTAADAKELHDQLKTGITAGITLAGLAAMNDKRLEPIIEFLKSVKTTTKDKTLTLKAEISGEELGKLIPKDQ